MLSHASSWHALYGVELRGLQRLLRDRNQPPGKASEWYDYLEMEMNNLFPALDGGSLSPKPS